MRRALALSCLPLCGLVLSACATTTSTGSFKGTQHAVAQTIANLQADVTAGEQAKICAQDLAAKVVGELGGKRGCEAAIKEQLAEVDGTEANVESVQVNGTSATARVKSTVSGKKSITTVVLLEEGGKWKISALR